MHSGLSSRALQWHYFGVRVGSLIPMEFSSPLELVCPAGSLPALKAAVDNGASCVYLGLRDATNARNFAGLNFDEAAIATGIRYAHDRCAKVFMALNTYPQASNAALWRTAVDKAADLGVDAVILADPGLDPARRIPCPSYRTAQRFLQPGRDSRRCRLRRQ